MAYKYRESTGTFNFFPPVNVVTEDEYGTGAGGHIDYYGVSSCTTVTLLLSDGTALGTHLTFDTPAATVDAIIAQMNQARAGRVVSQLYLVGVLPANGNGWKNTPRYAWPTQIQTFNVAFGRPAGSQVLGYQQAPGIQRDYRAIAAVQASAMAWLSRPKKGNAPVGQPWQNVNLIAL